MVYYARYKSTMMYLSTDNQMDSYLRAGFDIYSQDDAGNRELIATSEDGFLKERPVFPVPETNRRDSTR